MEIGEADNVEPVQLFGRKKKIKHAKPEHSEHNPTSTIDTCNGR